MSAHYQSKDKTTNQITHYTYNAIYFLHSDHLSTPRLATDQNKQTVWQWKSSAFGVGAATEQGLSLNLRFPGHYYDKETQLHYNHYRYYQPLTGRYLRTDPTGLDEGGTNPEVPPQKY